MSQVEMKELFAAYGLSVIKWEPADIRQRLKSWLALM